MLNYLCVKYLSDPLSEFFLHALQLLYHRHDLRHYHMGLQEFNPGLVKSLLGKGCLELSARGLLLTRARHEVELSTDLLVKLSKSTCISVDQHAIALVPSHLIFGTQEVSVSWLGNFFEP